MRRAERASKTRNGRNGTSAVRTGAVAKREGSSSNGSRLPVQKTYKLFIGGAFPRSESGRTYLAQDQNVARGSRKDLRDAVRAARAALPKWAGMSAYNRGQVLYRLGGMGETPAGGVPRVLPGPPRGP